MKNFKRKCTGCLLSIFLLLISSCNVCVVCLHRIKLAWATLFPVTLEEFIVYGSIPTSLLLAPALAAEGN